MTRNDLYNIDSQIIEMKKEKQALAVLLMKPIRDFYAAAGMELKITNERFRAILKKYAEQDDEGNLLTTGEGENKKWKFKESYTLADTTIMFGAHNVEQLFNQEVRKLMEQPIIIDL